ncbi:hypothetical protein J8F10_16770 [Gemmata sp. G18]|uniref:Uncharacterized protein n=1 Tax=Gemmata palustris TaxID=2822762 RepID=A0ABS5BT75_9BACT|nr:hypothetical protein [Gemmata palustris]MBP3956926.1 hypothetical protein [Gemmata palustris]
MPPRPNPELMVIGDSLPQGCRSLSVTADFCSKSWPARVAAVQGWQFDTPDFPRPVLFDLEDDILRQLDLVALVARHSMPGFIGRLRQNLADWVRNDKTSQHECFDNVAVAGYRVFELYKATAATAQATISARTANGTLLEQLSNSGAAELHVAINTRFTLNPGQDPQFANFTQLDWVRARVPKRLVVQIGHNHGLYEVGSDAVVTSVTGGNDGEGSYFDQWAELAKQLAELPAGVEQVLVCLLPKLGAVANLRPKGPERENGYALGYEPVFSIQPNTLSGTDLAAIDQSIRDANAKIQELVRAAAEARGTAGRIRFINTFEIFDRFDFKNSGDAIRRVLVPERPTLDNQYLDRTLFRREIVAGGFQSADGMHASAVGYALLASEIMTVLGIAHDRGAILQTAFDGDALLGTRSSNLDALVGILGSIRRTQINLGINLGEAIATDQLGIGRVLAIGKSIFSR